MISFSEEIHGERALRMLREINDTDSNLKESFQSEVHVAGVAVDDNFIELAEEVEDAAVFECPVQFQRCRRCHAKLYKNAINHLIGERSTTYYVCHVCGMCQMESGPRFVRLP